MFFLFIRLFLLNFEFAGLLSFFFDGIQPIYQGTFLIIFKLQSADDLDIFILRYFEASLIATNQNIFFIYLDIASCKLQSSIR